MEEIVYTVRPGMRHATKTRRDYPVMEIIVNESVIGALHSADGYLFGEIEWPDGTRESHGDCTRHYDRSESFMVRDIWAARLVGAGQDWRVSLPHRAAFTAHRAPDAPTDVQVPRIGL